MKLVIDKPKQINIDYQVIENWHAKYSGLFKFINQALEEQHKASEKCIDEYLRKLRKENV